MPKEPIDTSNDYLVGVVGDDIVVSLPIRGRLSKERALVLAAYLVALAGVGRGRWEEVLHAVGST